MIRQARAVLGVLLVLAAFGVGAEPPFPYRELIRQYAAGERALALGELQGLSAEQVGKELEAVREEVARAGRCSSCPPAPEILPLRAAVMLHTDRDEMDRRPILVSGERAPTCGPPVQAGLAEAALGLLLVDAPGREFARRWYLAMALRSLGDICFDEGLRWTAAGLKKFAKDKELLLARGMLDEASVTLAPLRAPNAAALYPSEQEMVHDAMLDGRLRLTEAAGSFEDALAADPGFEEAALRLGRVRLRLNQQESAIRALASVLATSRDPRRLYLAHLFLGRAHEAAQRAPLAEREYQEALALDPRAQAAATALGHLRLMAGDPARAREIVDAALARAESHADDPFWEYSVGAGRQAEPLFEALRAEATR